MNGRKARALRKQVYGDHSIRGRKFKQVGRGVLFTRYFKDQEYKVVHTGQLICADPLRQEYQRAKGRGQ